MDDVMSGALNPLARIAGESTSAIFDADSLSCQTLIIVGNGAVINGNLALNAAIARQKNEEAFGANASLGNFSGLDAQRYLAALASLNRVGKEIAFEELEKIDPETETLKEAFSVINSVQGLRRRISEEYESTSGKTSLRSLPKVIEDSLSDSGTIAITTNWDNSLWEDVRFKNLLYLHGRQGFPASILLPSESTQDRRFSLVHLTKISSSQELRQFLPTLAEGHDFSGWATLHNHIGFRAWANSARRVIFWGHALHPYDAEIIGLLLVAGSSPIEREVVCINPDGDACNAAASLLSCSSYRVDLN